MRCSIVPPYLLARLAAIEDRGLEHVAAAAQAALAIDEPLRCARHAQPAPPSVRQSAPRPPARELEGPQRTIFDAGHAESLPGKTVRTEGQPAGSDTSVSEAYDGLGSTHALYRFVYSRASIDDNNLPLRASVHYGRDYDNAFWNGDQMVFGDGDGTVFRGFTSSLSVVGHELTHGVTQHSANLTYLGQSGALNESISDVFGALVEQYSLGQSAEEASWLIGDGLFTDQVQGRALRSMKEPGTAYDDDVLGKDPQPADMQHYIDTEDDNGGVHLNSGIPNRAFCLAALQLGGLAWEGAGRIWYDTLVGGAVPVDCDFARFAAATTKTASESFGGDSPEYRAVADAWRTVGVTG
jgi:Zn-dependent metalloprotease